MAKKNRLSRDAMARAIEKVIRRVQLRNERHPGMRGLFGVTPVIHELWNELDLSAAERRVLAVDGLTERVIRVARRRRVPKKLHAVSFVEPGRNGEAKRIAKKRA